MFPPLAWKTLSPELFADVLSWLDIPSFVAFKVCTSSIASSGALRAIESAMVRQSSPHASLHGTSALAWAFILKRGEQLAREHVDARDVFQCLRSYTGSRILEMVSAESGPVVTLCVVVLVKLLELHDSASPLVLKVRRLIMSRLNSLFDLFPEARRAASMVGLHALLGANLKEGVAPEVRANTLNILESMLTYNRQAALAVAQSAMRLDILQLLRDGIDEVAISAIKILVHLLNLCGEGLAKQVCADVRCMDCIPRIVRLLNSQSELSVVPLMVFDCVAGDEEGSAAIRLADGIPIIMRALKKPASDIQDVALSILCKMLSLDLASCTEVCLLGGVDTFLTLLAKPSCPSRIFVSLMTLGKQGMVVDILSCLAVADPSVATKIRTSQGIEPLLRMIESKDAYARDAACIALHVLVKADPECATCLRKAGGLPMLTTLSKRTDLVESEMWLGAVVSKFLGTTCAAANLMASLTLQAIGDDESSTKKSHE